MQEQDLALENPQGTPGEGETPTGDPKGEPKEEKKEIDLLQEMKTFFGRKMKDLETSFDAKLDQRFTTYKPEPEPVYNEPDNDELITRKEAKELAKKALYEENENARKGEEQYQADYYKGFSELGAQEDDADWYNTVYQEMIKNHNNRHTGNGRVDAQMNYRNAENALLKKQRTVDPQPNVLGEEPRSGFGGPPTNKRGGKTVVTLPKLDKATQGYVEHLRSEGMSDEQIKEMLEE